MMEKPVIFCLRVEGDYARLVYVSPPSRDRSGFCKHRVRATQHRHAVGTKIGPATVTLPC